MASVVFSYSHHDEALRDELEAHLAGLRCEGLITTWHDRRIVAGQPLDKTIDTHFKTADLILILISSDFINSNYCYETELRQAMARHERGEAVVIPVILRPCEWRDLPFGHLLAVPKDGKAVTTWSNRDEAFQDITRAVRTALSSSGRSRTPAPSLPPQNRQARVAPTSPNLRLPRTFSEKDKDDFLEEAFGRIASFFENSLSALERENPGVETKFRRLDARRFTAVAYRGGKTASRCTIWMGGRSTFVGGIGYVENDSGETNSFNENLSVEADEGSLYLKPLAMAFVGEGRLSEKMSPEEASEHLWTLFLRRLRQTT